MNDSEQPIVGVVMGSKSDWETMRAAAERLSEFGVPHECRVVSAHRTPEWMCEYAQSAEERGLEIIIAGVGGAAHLPGMIATQTVLSVFGVPVRAKALNGLDSLLSIVQMPAGVPVGTLAIGQAGAGNAAWFDAPASPGGDGKSAWTSSRFGRAPVAVAPNLADRQAPSVRQTCSATFAQDGASDGHGTQPSHCGIPRSQCPQGIDVAWNEQTTAKRGCLRKAT